MPQNKRKFVAWRLRLTNGAREASHSELENADRWLESSETVFGAMVFFGVAFEVLIAAENPPYGSCLERWGSCVADAFVALGVLGELLASARGRLVHGELTRRSAAELADARKVAGSANERAAGIERVTARRKLSPEKQSEIASAIRPLVAGRPAVVEFQNGDAEAWQLACEIRAALHSAGCNRVTGRSNMLGIPAFGVVVGAGDGISLAPLLRAFIDAGIASSPVTIPGYLLTTEAALAVYVFVGPKPPVEL